MSMETEIQNTSLSLPDREEPSKSNIPVRNAISTVKRLHDPIRSGRLSFKPIRLDDLTQEWLEAENEPLQKPTDYEEDKEAESDESEDKLIEDLEKDLDELCIKSPENNNKEVGHELGVAWLETPAKIREIYATTPKLHCAPSAKQVFVTPYTVKTRLNEKSANKPKIQYSVDIKSMLLTTPLNNGVRRECQPLNKRTIPQVTITNTSGESVLSEAKIKSSIRYVNDNKENVPKIVQFSLPAEIKSFKEIKVKDVTYIIMNQLGIGGSSVVYHCYNPNTNTECAIKKVSLDNEANRVGYINEVKVLERLQKCDRIIKMFEYELLESEKTLLVVLERGGLDLSKILKDLSSTNKHIPMYILIFYWMEMLHAVKQIHDNGIIHSDLKPGNFLQAEGGLKLIDFGIASSVQDDMTSVVKDISVGTFNYVSPEALTSNPSDNSDSPSFGKPKFKVSYKSDVWSLGCILYQLVYRRTPFQHIGNTWAKLTAILDPKHQIDYPDVEWVHSRIVNTIKQCLQFNMRARPSVDELIREYENIYN